MAILISIAALFVSWLRCEPLEADWIGILVGVLSLLVTILIGWQIYSVIDMKKTVDDIKIHSTKTQEETMARAYTSIMNQTTYIVEGRNDDDCYNAISNGLFACKHYHLAGNNIECAKLLNMIANFKKENCTLSRKHITDLFVIVGQLKECKVNVEVIETWLNNFTEDEINGEKQA